MTVLIERFNILTQGTVLIKIVHNQGLFWHFHTLRDYCGYSLHIQGLEWLLSHIISC